MLCQHISFTVEEMTSKTLPQTVLGFFAPGSSSELRLHTPCSSDEFTPSTI